MKSICSPRHSVGIAATGVVIFAASALTTGCGFGSGPSAYSQMKQTQDSAIEGLTASGGQATKKNYPLGTGWVVNLSDATITDQTIESLGALDRVAELDVSGSSITDQQLAAIAVPEKLGVLIKLNLSNTQISDAGLKELDDLNMIYDLNVKGSKITPQALEAFRKSRPKHPLKLRLKVTK